MRAVVSGPAVSREYRRESRGDSERYHRDRHLTTIHKEDWLGVDFIQVGFDDMTVLMRRKLRGVCMTLDLDGIITK